MSGGETKGWTPDVAFKLWHRMLIALGNVNTLENILLHEKVFQYLLDLNSTMTKVNKIKKKIYDQYFNYKLNIQ